MGTGAGGVRTQVVVGTEGEVRAAAVVDSGASREVPGSDDDSGGGDGSAGEEMGSFELGDAAVVVAAVTGGDGGGGDGEEINDLITAD